MADLSPWVIILSKTRNLLDSIWESDFSRTVTADPAELIETVRSRAMPYSGNWARRLPERIVGSTYEGWIEEFIDLIWESCGKEPGGWRGFLQGGLDE